MRCIRSQADSLMGGLPKQEMMAMALGLAHSLSRYKLKFSPDKIDTMIVQVWFSKIMFCVSLVLIIFVYIVFRLFPYWTTWIRN